MSEEQQNKAAIVNREDLYQQVWEKPMFQLGAHYGISGNGLKKICDRLERPLPAARLLGQAQCRQIRRADAAAEDAGRYSAPVTITPTPPVAAAARAPELDPETAGRLQEASAKTAAAAPCHRGLDRQTRARDCRCQARSFDLRRRVPAKAVWLRWNAGSHRILSTLFKEAEKARLQSQRRSPAQPFARD